MMKFAHIRYDGKDSVVVRFDDSHLVSLDTLLGSTESSYRGLVCDDMSAVIRAGRAFLSAIDATLGNFTEHPDRTKLMPIAGVSWYPPVRNPGKISGIAMNNSASNARKISAPDHPAFFTWRLVRTNEGLKIKSRRVDLLNADAPRDSIMMYV